MSRFNITVKRSKRKTISLEVQPDGDVILRAPSLMKDKDIQDFLEKHEDWLIYHVEQAKKKTAAREQVTPLTQNEIHELTNLIKIYLSEKLPHYASQLGVDFGTITLRMQKTRWGSCSSKGNLNFNILLGLCPEEVRDYVICHELCHRLEMNHSPAFWAHVQKVCPEYKKHRQWLKTHGDAIMSRRP